MTRKSGPALLLLLLLLASLACTARKAAFEPLPESVPAAAPAPPSSPAAVRDLQSEGFGEQDLTLEGNGKPGPAAIALESAGSLATVFFDYDSPALGDEALRILETNARWLQSHPGVRVVIEGHCDERGTLEYNLGLGARRAAAVRDHLIRLGVAALRLETVSYGEERPAADGHEETSWSQNRRAEFKVQGP